MSARNRYQVLFTMMAFLVVIMTASLMSCRSIRQYYASGRPDGNLRTLPPIPVMPAEPPCVRIIPLSKVDLPCAPIKLSEAPGVIYGSAATFGMVTVDIHDPAQPRVAAYYEGMIGPKDPASRVFLAALPEPESKRIFMLDRLHGIGIWDAGDPLHPKPPPVMELKADVGNQPMAMQKVGTFYYLACGGGGLMRVPADDPAAQPEVLLSAFDHTRDLTFHPPNWLLVSDGYETGMQILDISEHRTPRVAHIFNAGTYCDQVVVIHGHAVMASRTLGFVVVNMQDPTAPYISTKRIPIRGSEVKSLGVWKERYLIVGYKARASQVQGGIEIFDMKRPEQPRLEVRLPLDSEVNTMVVQEDLLVAGQWNTKQLALFTLAEN